MGIWAFCKNPGGVAGMLPVVNGLRKNHQVRLIVDRITAEKFFVNQEGVSICDSVEDVLSNVALPKIFLTSIYSDKSAGYDLIPSLKGRCLTVALQDSWAVRTLIGRNNQEHRPDYICVNDGIGAEIVAKAWPSFSRENIAICGYPALDKYADYDTIAAEREVRALLQMDKETPIVLFPCNLIDYAGEELSEVVSVLNNINRDIYFIPRFHPRTKDEAPQEIPKWQKALDDFHGGRLIPDSSKCETSLLIAASTVVLSEFSTVLLEAAALRKQNISMLYHKGRDVFSKETGGLLDEFPLVSLGCSAKAGNREELKKLIEKSLDDSIELRSAQEELLIDGKSANRVALFVESLIR